MRIEGAITAPSQPAAGKAWIALCIRLGRHCPDLSEPGRSAARYP